MGILDVLGAGDYKPKLPGAKHVDAKPHAALPDAVHVHDDHPLAPRAAPSPMSILNLDPDARSAYAKKLDEESEQKKTNALAERALRTSMNTVYASIIGTRLAEYSRNLDASKSKAFIQTLDAIDDADLRHKVWDQFRHQTGQSLKDFISGSKGWNNAGPNRDKEAAAQLLDSDRDAANERIRMMSPEERAVKESAANDYAIEILKGSTAHDQSAKNQQQILSALQGRDDVEIEMIRAAIRKHTNNESNLYQVIDNGMRGGNEDEAITMLKGDRIESAHAVFANELDPDRRREVLKQLSPAERRQLAAPREKERLLKYVLNPADRAELSALLDGKHDKANAERLGNLLKAPKDGVPNRLFGGGLAFDLDIVAQDNYRRRDEANVLKEFESMSGDEVREAAIAWKRDHGESFESMLADRFDDDEPEYQRLLAMIRGDKGQNRSLRFQQGLLTNNQDMIEGALAHDTVSTAQLSSSDPEVARKARAIQQENALFELHNVAASRTIQRVRSIAAHRGDERSLVGKGTQEQLEDYYKEYAETEREYEGAAGFALGSGAKDTIRRGSKEQARTNKIATDELLADGKLSIATQVHRGKDAKAKAEALAQIATPLELEDAKDYYKDTYGQELFATPDDERADMSANELMIDNIRLYGPAATRPAQLEYMLQAQQYKLRYSDVLERSEHDKAGGGTQTWQRQELAAQRRLLNGNPLAFEAPQKVESFGYSVYLDASPSFDQIQSQLPTRVGALQMDDNLANGVTKRDYNLLDNGMTEANAAQGAAKKRLSDRITKVITTIGKIASIAVGSPALVLLLDTGKGLLDMVIKESVMGEAYDPTLDAQVLAFTIAADAAMLGATKAGKAGLGGGGKEAWEQVGKGAKEMVKTTRDAVKEGKSPTELLRALVAEGIDLKLPDYLADQVKEAIGKHDDDLASVLLAKIATSGVELATSTGTQMAVAGESFDDALAGEAYDMAKGWVKDAKKWAIDEDGTPHKSGAH